VASGGSVSPQGFEAPPVWALPVGVAVHVFEAGLMHVPMSVLGPVLVAVRVLVLDVVVLMRGMRM
jgi:hypothetical protein